MVCSGLKLIKDQLYNFWVIKKIINRNKLIKVRKFCRIFWKIMVNEIMEIGRCRRSSGQSTYSFPSIGLQCSENEWRTNGERCSRVNNSRFHKTPLSTQRIEVARRVTLPSEFDWNPGEYRESVEFPMNKSRQTIAWSWMDVFKRFKINKQASFHIPEQRYRFIILYIYILSI